MPRDTTPASGPARRTLVFRASRLLARLALALSLIPSGLARVLAVAAPPPTPSEQLLRLGEFSRHHLLEVFLGYSPPFQIYTGLGALAAGLLLLSARTTLLGALLAITDLGMLLIQGVLYPGPVALPALLLPLALFLAAPHARRLIDGLLLHRTVQPSPPEPLFAHPSRQRALERGVVLLGFAVLAASAVVDLRRWRAVHPPRPPLYGAWKVERWLLDGAEVPVDGDPGRWRGVAVEQDGTALVEDGLGARRRGWIAVDGRSGSLAIAGPAPYRLAYHQPESDVLLLEGLAESEEKGASRKALRVELRRMLLYAERFHWVFEPEEDDK